MRKAAPSKNQKRAQERSVHSEPSGELVEAIQESWRQECPDLGALSKEDMAPVRLLFAIEALRDGRPIDRESALYLADALEEALQNPAKAAEALGIKRPRGRGNFHTRVQYLRMAIDVHILRSMDFAMTPSNRDRGVLERVAERHHCSIDTVERAWEQNRFLIEAQEAFRASETEEGAKE